MSKQWVIPDIHGCSKTLAALIDNQIKPARYDALYFLGDYIVYDISNEKYMLNPISTTFHGRDIFTPVAAHITNDVPFEKIGNRIDDFVDLDFGQGEIRENAATGKVI